jgi:hypothetical protein
MFFFIKVNKTNMAGGYFDIKAIQKQKSYTYEEMAINLFMLTIKLLIMVVLITVNFLALSIALNCNKESPISTKIAAAVYAFLFGFIYLFINYYSYRVMTQGKLCEFDQEYLFPT